MRRVTRGGGGVSGLGRRRGPGRDVAVSAGRRRSVKCRQLCPSCSRLPLEELRLWRRLSPDDDDDDDDGEGKADRSSQAVLFFSYKSTPPHVIARPRSSGVKMELSSPTLPPPPRRPSHVALIRAFLEQVRSEGAGMQRHK